MSRDENGNFFSTSRVSRREREFFYSNLVFREGDENLKIISQGRARKNEPNSHENSRDREFSLCSDGEHTEIHFYPDYCPCGSSGVYQTIRGDLRKVFRGSGDHGRIVDC